MMCSLKVPALRRGNRVPLRWSREETGLNESPRPKAGNISSTRISGMYAAASMKVPAPRGK